MAINKVNNFKDYLLIRFFITIFLCFMTYYITGRIADMSFLSGQIDFAARGSRTMFARNIFSFLVIFENSYLIVIFISVISSISVYYTFNSFIDKKNSKYWYLLLLSPGILLYLNVPTKEILFFCPTAIFLSLECNSLLFWQKWNLSQKITNLIFKFIILIYMFNVRGPLMTPYLLLSIIVFIYKNFHFNFYPKRINIIKTMSISFLISVIFISIFYNIYPVYFENNILSLSSSFEKSALTREYIDYYFLTNPFNIFRIQYLSLFPSINEVISKPYSLIIFIESTIYIYLYYYVWKRLFNLTIKDKKMRTLNYIIFIFCCAIYFVLYSYISCINIGSGQRFRINFIPLGLIFPLLMEKKIRSILEIKS